MFPRENDRAFVGIWSGRHATRGLRCRADDAKQPRTRLLLDTSPSAAASSRRADAPVPTAPRLALPPPQRPCPVAEAVPMVAAGVTSTKQCTATCPPAALSRRGPFTATTSMYTNKQADPAPRSGAWYREMVHWFGTPKS